jgi:acyl-CoA synthetase (AMP-forming)/AMP-acid ligase II
MITMDSVSKPQDRYTPKLLVSAIEEKAKWLPNNLFMRYPGPDWETKGYETISWIQYANAINKVAYWLDDQLGPAAENDTIAYFGPSDPRYAIVVPAAIKTGRRVCREQCTGRPRLTTPIRFSFRTVE